MQRAHVERMARRLGVDEQAVVRQYGLPALPEVPESFVYLVGHSEVPADGDPVKVGYTRNLPLRLEDMQAGSVPLLLVLAVREGGRAEEREIHERLFMHQIRQDWFEMCDEVRAAFPDVNHHFRAHWLAALRTVLLGRRQGTRQGGITVNAGARAGLLGESQRLDTPRSWVVWSAERSHPWRKRIAA